MRTTSTTPFCYVHYTHESSNYVVSLVGSGEFGAADGSQIYKVENYGYAKQAKAGFNFPFNLFVPQGLPGFGSTDWSKVFLSYSQLSVGKTGSPIYNVLPEGKKVGIGWSQGSSVLFNQLFDSACEFDAMILIAGKPSGTPDYSKAKDIPLIFIHSCDDTAIGISQSRKMVAGLNATDRKNKAILLELPTGGHSGAMNAAYNIEHPIGKQVYDLILSTFKSEKPGIYVDGVWYGETFCDFEGHRIEFKQ